MAPSPTQISTLSLHDALPICAETAARLGRKIKGVRLDSGDLLEKSRQVRQRSEEHTSELQSLTNLVCRLLLEKKKWMNCSISLMCRGSVILPLFRILIA